jgi:hypothetical protein
MKPSRVALAAIAAPLVACLGASNGPNPPDTAADIAQYEALRQELDTHRSQFLPTGMRDPGGAIGHRLFWADYGGGASPPLWSYDEQSGQRLEYAFSIGDATANNVNYRGSNALVVTTDESNIYRAYATTEANQLVGQFTMTPPTGEQKWWAYTADGNQVYVVTTDASMQLWQWQPGQTDPTASFTLDSAGITAGELWDFDISGTWGVVIESGAVWSLDLATRTSALVPAQNQLDVGNPISFDGRGILYTEQGGQTGDLVYYAVGTGALTDVSAAIAASPFRINATFAEAHHYDSGGILFGHKVVYVGQLGLFEYDLDSGAVTPILLAPHVEGLRIDYRSPRVLASGDIYVVGLTSNDGAIGVDGPLYEVHAP